MVTFLGCTEEWLVVRRSFLPETTNLSGVNFLMKRTWENLEKQLLLSL